MTDLETALRLLSIEEKWLQPFAVQDPFGDLALEGFLSRKPDHRYGALAITRVDGRPAPQRVLATPKIHYPFDRGGKFRFPPVAGIAIYEKLDGTNVLAYRYRDADGRLHTTASPRSQASSSSANACWRSMRRSVSLWRRTKRRSCERSPRVSRGTR